jgi:glutamine---fructose-6-phosphate transaminase (isomerizing)
MSPGLIVVGHCTIDDIHHAGGRELPQTMGGAAAYATLGAALVGGEVSLVTVIGEDYPLDKLRFGLTAGRAVVDTTHCRRVEGRSIHYDAWYTADGNRHFEVESWDRLEELTPMPPDLPIDAIHGGIVVLTPASIWQQEALVEALAPVDCRVALDTETHYFTDDSLRRRLLALARKVDLFLPSIEHLQVLFDSKSESVLDYVPQLQRLGCPMVAVKSGSRGSVVLDLTSGTIVTVPALEVDMVDATGAGDGYGGGFLSALGQRLGLDAAAASGTVAASFVVESVGASVPAHFNAALADARFERLAPLIESSPFSRSRPTRSRPVMTDVAANQTFLEAEIPQQGDLLRDVLTSRVDTVRDVVRAASELEPSGWVVTGCGDSLFAGMCAEYWFAELGRLPLRAIHALAFSRYLYRSIDSGSVVFAVSFSGSTARVVEAAVAAKSRGAAVVAVTANRDSRLVELADWWLPNDALAERSNCRTLSFEAACALLHLVAADVAEVATPHASTIAAAVDTAVADSAQQLQKIVASLPSGLEFTLIGGGYGYPLACYGAAKLYEAATIPAHAAELEQFIHCEIFPVSSSSCVVLIAPQGASYARAVEVARGLRELGAVTIGISDEPELGELCNHFVQLPAGLGESELPYAAAVPLQYLALEVALRSGENPDIVANKRVNRPLIESPLAWTAEDYEVRV